MTFLKLLFVISSYMIYCSAETNRITCYPQTTAEPTRQGGANTPAPIQSGGGQEPITEPPVEDDQDIAACASPPNTDVIILNDVSCPISEAQCDTQQRMIAQMMLAIKGEDSTGSDKKPTVRVGYITFDAAAISVVVSISDDRYNLLPVNESDIESLYDTLRNSQTCSSAPDRAADGEPALLSALKKAKNLFRDYGDSQRDPRIIIFSNCKVGSAARPNICSFAQTQTSNGVNMYLVHNGGHFAEDDTYLMCLAEYDANRVFINTAFNYTDWDRPLGIRDKMRDDFICWHPTPAPTSDPTSDPTADPTVVTAETPLEALPVRRLYEFDISGANSPCITFEIKLETENLLPHNTQPDPASNIAIIGRAIANVTGGVVTVPYTPDEADGERLEDFPDYVPWVLDANCTDDSQMIDYYMPKLDWSPDCELVVEETDSGFVVRSELVTNNSIVYEFRVNTLMLDITSDCSGAIDVTAGIFLSDTLIEGTSTTTTVPAFNTESQMFVLDEAATYALSPGVVHEIRFEFAGSYPNGCAFSSFSFDSTDRSRRRLAGTVDGEANPSSCVMGSSLAKSPDMIAAVTSMCNSDVNNRLDIETGIFKQQCSDTAVGDHLLKTGSLSLYDMATGDLTKTIADFPAHNVEMPCIAVDEANLIIYAVGGYNSAGVVKYIQAYRFDDDSFRTGSILPYDGWELVEPLYGASCLVWSYGGEQKLVVVGGMTEVGMEYGSKGDWENYIRIYPVPDADSENPWFFPSDPESGTGACRLAKQLMGMRLLLIDDHNLYMFGGKTHVASKEFVQRLDLNTINSCAAVREGFDLAEKKAMPMNDKVLFEGDACYMIFSGQSYEGGAIVAGDAGLNFDLLQVFCNGMIERTFDESTRRRLVGVEAGAAFTEFDAKALAESGRRRLGETGEKTQVNMRHYKYVLDGIWYNFTVTFELCYADNQELEAAVDYFDSVLDEKPNGEIWQLYQADISEKILNCSLEAYEGWSNGFGAVNVWDLDKVSVRYDSTPAPAISIKSHPERRKARFWWSNLGEIHDDEWHYADCDGDECEE